MSNLTAERKKEIKHKVLGLTGKELETEVKFKTFCSLCMRMLPQGDMAIGLIGENGYQFFIHTNCAIEQKVKMHKAEFLKDVKMRPQTKKTRRNQKKEHQGDGKIPCSFCRKAVKTTQTYVVDGKRKFHKSGTNSCWTRYKRVMDTRKSTITYYSK